ncbi:aa3 type cytochrome c oxidase subunit IV [Rhodothalassium salexigens DSM 2132]|uniref:Aa3 type cytochrome c oxidase subunit IV n=1 Tax=Rhodothalassium salexigens DSM 2132 TaxID=1188247 RepID=A0A4R2PSC9_RHOSA|nr:aa3-type cytochrome c oxidase subunit IV [Rhodothalassium salexigens]MBB4210585.1 flagellar biosynthesis/type III secretory pathway M-ring protein FliF/YscJ [Rhodothalassium salexigens DSM 2132]MBK1639731.1 hypothetical protein [Rhodothalassium salexigens DSM 2132]TCP37858.1 aa3 type cytochrome c oxidase subunit IV [Rhodothalassium salexigens DSM 2132]
MRIDEQEQTYQRFTQGTKWAMVGAVLVLVALAAFLV